jgi:hypothetical protein
MPRKKYSINWENDEAGSFEVNGVVYNSLEDVPDEKDRGKLAAMLQAAEDDADFEDVKFDEKEFEELHKMAESKTMEKTVLGIFTVFSALMLIFTAFSISNNIQKLGREESAPGRVVDVQVRQEVVNEQERIVRDFYFPVIEFTAADGQTRTVPLNEGSDSPYYEKGDEVTVLYDPGHPLDARIKSFGGALLMWVLPSITGILGIAFAGGVFVVRKLMPSE